MYLRVCIPNKSPGGLPVLFQVWGLDFKVCDFCTLAGSFGVLEGPEETPLVSARGWFSRL